VRLDLFLKTSRLVKRRTVAQEMCSDGRVLVNGQAAKPAKEINAGDALRLSYSTRIIDIEVLSVPVSAKNVKSLPEEMYRVISDQRILREDFDK
jgi:ribosomal 50S subunit-recycling heat shock protein